MCNRNHVFAPPTEPSDLGNKERAVGLPSWLGPGWSIALGGVYRLGSPFEPSSGGVPVVASLAAVAALGVFLLSTVSLVSVYACFEKGGTKLCWLPLVGSFRKIDFLQLQSELVPQQLPLALLALIAFANWHRAITARASAVAPLRPAYSPNFVFSTYVMPLLLLVGPPLTVCNLWLSLSNRTSKRSYFLGTILCLGWWIFVLAAVVRGQMVGFSLYRDHDVPFAETAFELAEVQLLYALAALQLLLMLVWLTTLLGRARRTARENSGGRQRVLAERPPNFIFQLSVGAAGVLAATFGISQISRAHWYGTLASVVSYGLCARLTWRYWKQLGAKSGLERVLADPRSPILFLRNFRNDGEVFIEKLTLEEIVEKVVAPSGPFVAIGRPAESLATLGAARFYLPDQDWQEMVVRLMDAAQIIVLAMGIRPAVAWEAQQIWQRGHMQKLVLVPVRGLRSDRRRLWQQFRASLCAEFSESLAKVEAEDNLLYVAFSADGIPVPLRGPYSEENYVSALAEHLRRRHSSENVATE